MELIRLRNGLNVPALNRQRNVVNSRRSKHLISESEMTLAKYARNSRHNCCSSDRGNCRDCQSRSNLANNSDFLSKLSGDCFKGETA